jgi:hypothetical protein
MLKITAAILIASPFLCAAALDLSASGSTSIPQRGLKGDRLPVGPACSQRAWPNYENHCVRRPALPAGRPREVRIVNVGGLSAKRTAVAFANDRIL